MSAGADKKEDEASAVEPRVARKKKKLVLIGGALITLLAIGGGLGAMGMLPFLHHASGPQKIITAATSHVPVFIDLPEMVVNLDAGARHETFAKVQCRVEADSATDGAKVTAAVPRVVDMLQIYLRAMRPDELQSGAGLYRLKEAFLARASIVVPDAHLDDILFQELIVQ